MAAIKVAKQAYSFLNHEKPHSSITDWVEILTSPNVEEEAYDGIPELVDAINLQPTGPAEASRAIRKKLKHGNAHQQYRALVILKALVENGGHKFQTSFADSQLTDAIRMLATDPMTDQKVKKKLFSVLASWKQQFAGDPSMSLVASLYDQYRPITRTSRTVDSSQLADMESEYDRRRKEEKEKKEAAKRKAKEDKEREKRKKEQKGEKMKRKPFEFEQEKPQIFTAIAGASQASSNLVNAITLVNTEHDSVKNNERVQECLEKAKQVRKQIVRYIQLVENEELIGTLIETNDRVVAALEMYDTLSKPTVTEDEVAAVQQGVANAHISGAGELHKLQQQQRAAVERAANRGKSRADSRYDREAQGNVHPDLNELSFGSLGAEQHNLPPPLRPTAPRTSSDDDDYPGGGSLSDFSDYVSSDEETHNKRVSGAPSSSAYSNSNNRRPYATANDDDVDVRHDTHQGLLHSNDNEDPFADPFADPV